jgi:hypothetical protein
MSETPRIRWQETQPGILDGYAGTLQARLFGMWQPPQFGGLWVLTSELPGMGDERRTGTDPEGLKPEAEKLLSQFTSSLGALFPGDVLGWVVAESRPVGSDWPQLPFAPILHGDAEGAFAERDEKREQQTSHDRRDRWVVAALNEMDEAATAAGTGELT